MKTEKVTEPEINIAALANTAQKVDAMNELAFEIRNSDTQRSISLCKDAQQLSSEINYPLGNATALSNEAFCYVQITDYELALEKLVKALQIFEEFKNEKGTARVYYNLCLVYYRFSDFNNGLDCITKALSYYQKTNNSVELGRCYFQMGFLYHSLNDDASGIDYLTKSLELNRQANNRAGEAAAIMGLGQAYLSLKDYDKCRAYLMESMAIREQIKDWRGYAAALNAYMTLCIETGKNEEAEEVSLKGIQLATELGDKMGISRFMLDLGKIYLKQNNTEEAERKLKEALTIAEKINLRMALAPIHFSLSEIYKLKNNFEQALFHYQRFHEVKEEMVNIDAAMKAKSMQFVSKVENAQKEAEINRLKNVELKNAYDEIARKNKDITDSINYAKRIQQAKLPKREEITATLPHSFVLFKPKDIVSGDFYFFHKNNRRVFIAAADCTGHGVPGALMSMIGSEKLEDAVLQSNEPSEILSLLNKGVKTSLRQSFNEESTRDGMDIAFCAIDIENRTINYAGANRPLWLIRKGGTEAEELKATKTAIGGLTEDNQQFEQHELKLEPGDTFYICTDGYADQFGGRDGKKLMAKKLKDILLSIQTKSMQEQQHYLDDYIENWKAGLEQVDDILVIGLRLC